MALSQCGNICGAFERDHFDGPIEMDSFGSGVRVVVCCWGADTLRAANVFVAGASFSRGRRLWSCWRCCHFLSLLLLRRCGADGGGRCCLPVAFSEFADQISPSSWKSALFHTINRIEDVGRPEKNYVAIAVMRLDEA